MFFKCKKKLPEIRVETVKFELIKTFTLSILVFQSILQTHNVVRNLKCSPY